MDRYFLFAIFFSSIFSCKAQTAGESLLVAAPGSPIAMYCSPGNVAAGDLDNDGKPDLVLTCAQNRLIVLLKGKGNGQFDPFAVNKISLPYPPNELVIGDLNKDGNADLIIGSHDSYTILILQGDGKGNFSDARDSVIMRKGSQPHTHGLGIADFNNDGQADIATANSSDHDITVMLNRSGNYEAAPGSPFAVNPSPYPLTIGDVNSDGHLDIVSTSIHASYRELVILLGNGRGEFRKIATPLRTVDPWYVAIGDINKDEVPDLVMTHAERHELSVLLGSGNDRFTEVNGSPFDLGSNAWQLALVDINRDGNPDVVTAANNGVRVLLGDGKGNFNAAPGSPFRTGRGSWHLAVSDVNGDGKLDIITSNLETNNVSVLLGK